MHFEYSAVLQQIQYIHYNKFNVCKEISSSTKLYIFFIWVDIVGCGCEGEKEDKFQTLNM